MTKITPLDWSAACKLTIRDWQLGLDRAAYEITEHAYYWGLECVPPALQKSTGYLCGEPYTHNELGQPVYSSAVEHGGTYYAIGLMTVGDMMAFTCEDLARAIQCGAGRARIAIDD